MDVIQDQPKDQHNLQNQTRLRQLHLQKEIHDEWDNDQQQSQQQQQQQQHQQPAPAPATAEPTAEPTQTAGTTIQLCITIKPPKKQLPNLQEKQPYVDKWIRQRRQA